MRKLVFSLGFSLLFLTTCLVAPQSAEAAESGPAGKLKLASAPGPKAGEVTLTWVDGDSADNYHLVYGTAPANFQYGVLNIGTNNVYTVGKLNPGMKYYFALVPVMNNMAMYTSEWVAAWAAGGAVGQQPVVSQPEVKQPVSAAAGTSGLVDKHWLVARSGANEGEVTLNWRHADDVNNYHLVYGRNKGKFEYGALNIGWVTSYTVKKLVPGITYHFALVPVKNDVALYTTDQVMVPAKMNVQIVQTTSEVIKQSITSVTVTPAKPTPTTVLDQ